MDQQDMDIMEIINMMEETIDKASTVPLTGKIMIDKDELLDIIQELRIKMPDDLKQAKWIKSERQRILLEAQKEATTIIKSAEDKIISMINENEITKKANEAAEEIVKNANNRAREIRNATKQYIDDALSESEMILERTLGTLRDNRLAMQQNNAKKQVRIEEVVEAKEDNE